MENWPKRRAIAISATTRAAESAMAYFRSELVVETKPDQSPVTEADKRCEQEIRTLLGLQYPNDVIFGEEFGGAQDADAFWIIDPIDGTRSFMTGLPLFGVLLGFVSDGVPRLGVINMPALSEIYCGVVKQGALRNGKPIAVSTCTTLAQARLFINEGDKLALHEPQVFDELIHAGQVRRMGSDCYPHALVAAGLADAVVDYDLQPYDYLPVSAVVHAAGGVMTDWQGQPLNMQSDGRTLTAATPALHSELLALIKPFISAPTE